MKKLLITGCLLCFFTTSVLGDSAWQGAVDFRPADNKALNQSIQKSEDEVSNVHEDWNKFRRLSDRFTNAKTDAEQRKFYEQMMGMAEGFQAQLKTTEAKIAESWTSYANAVKASDLVKNDPNLAGQVISSQTKSFMGEIISEQTGVLDPTMATVILLQQGLDRSRVKAAALNIGTGVVRSVEDVVAMGNHLSAQYQYVVTMKEIFELSQKIMVKIAADKDSASITMAGTVDPTEVLTPTDNLLKFAEETSSGSGSKASTINPYADY